MTISKRCSVTQSLLSSTFDDEEWKIITLFVEHLDSQLKYTDLFAFSCGSIGDFFLILRNEWYVVSTKMQNFNFPVANSTAPFMSKFFHLNRSSFAPKCIRLAHCCSAHITLNLHCCNHLCIQFQYAKKPLQLLSDMEDDGTMSLDDSHCWRSDKTLRWLQVYGLSSVPYNIKEEIGSLGPGKEL